MHRNPYVNKHGLNVMLYERALTEALNHYHGFGDASEAMRLVCEILNLHGRMWRQALGWDFNRLRQQKKIAPTAEALDLERQIADHAEALIAKGKHFALATNIALKDAGLSPAFPARKRWMSRIGKILNQRKREQAHA